MRRAALLLLALQLAACTAVATGEAEPTGRPVGADADGHGCRASAGYRWCARTSQCERPWELAEDAGFEAGAAGFEAYCGQP